MSHETLRKIREVEKNSQNKINEAKLDAKKRIEKAKVDTIKQIESQKRQSEKEILEKNLLSKKQLAKEMVDIESSHDIKVEDMKNSAEKIKPKAVQHVLDSILKI